MLTSVDTETRIKNLWLTIQFMFRLLHVAGCGEHMRCIPVPAIHLLIHVSILSALWLQLERHCSIITDRSFRSSPYSTLYWSTTRSNDIIVLHLITLFCRVLSPSHITCCLNTKARSLRFSQIHIGHHNQSIRIRAGPTFLSRHTHWLILARPSLLNYTFYPVVQTRKRPSPTSPRYIYHFMAFQDTTLLNLRAVHNYLSDAIEIPSQPEAGLFAKYGGPRAMVQPPHRPLSALMLVTRVPRLEEVRWTAARGSFQVQTHHEK
jgi:hypothetical protein